MRVTPKTPRWTARRWWIAVGTAAAIVLIIGVPTDLIDTPMFSRDIPPTWWSWPTLVVSAVLSGLLIATYVNQPVPGAVAVAGPADSDRAAGRRGVIAAVLTFFAVGCPVCNKIVLLALGSSGALRFFEPAQPILAVAGIAVLGWALALRRRREQACPVNR